MEASIERETARSEDGAGRGGGRDSRPLGGYGAVMAIYGAGLGAWLISRRSRLPERFRAADLVLGGIASHKLSRLLSKEKVAAPLRAPFTEYEGDAGPAEVRETAKHTGGARSTIGELLACPYCLDQWVATGFAVGLVEAPRPTRFVASLFSTVAISDFLHLVYRAGQQ